MVVGSAFWQTIVVLNVFTPASGHTMEQVFRVVGPSPQFNAVMTPATFIGETDRVGTLRIV